MEVQDFLKNQSSPLEMLKTWVTEGTSGLREPLSTVLSTCDSKGQPASRVLLAKEIRKDGIVFYTNYNSAKGLQIQKNPKAAMNFYWDQLQKQVRIQGRIKKLTATESDRYWKTRPRASQLSQWTSKQSKPIANRTALETAYKAAEKRFEGRDVPRPPHWGGYILQPTLIEFWIGHPHRFHDRYVFKKTKTKWAGQRISP